MKIRILTSCTGEKRFSPENQLKLEDFHALHSPAFQTLEAQLEAFRTPAETLYAGQQHVRLMKGVTAYRQRHPEDIDLWILSAGYGVIHGSQPIVPYECTFDGMKLGEIKKWAEHLHVPTEARRFFAKPADLTIVLLSEAYLRALDLDGDVQYKSPTLFFTSTGSQKLVAGKNHYWVIPLAVTDAKRFSCALVGLKGELTRLLLSWLQRQGKKGIRTLFKPDADVLSLLDEEKVETQKATRPATKANPTVDKVINIPEEWWQKPHRAKLRYFIPEWDDLVDPDYDFEKDEQSNGIGDWNNMVYAHQIYPEPNYDGILISKVVAEKSKKKKERINAMGVHRYLRVPRQFPIMGDCGAFGYIGMEVPPYSTDEILDYYTRLDFDYGVSIDHLIVTAAEKQKKFRYDLTIHNAEEFLKEHRQRGLHWEPIGAVQGWNPQSYSEAARQYVAMGYNYIGLGGMVRTKTPEIIRILDAVHEVVPTDLKIHLFGIARFRAMNEFVKHGATSIDSASVLRRAWLGSTLNYLTKDGWYSAIRVPQSERSFRAKQLVKEGGIKLEDLKKLEKNCLDGLRAYAQGRVNPPVELVDHLVEYDTLIAGKRGRTREYILRTLQDRPWEKCGCIICQRWGVEVAIFRGNNRNRRRGFHNTYVFYHLIQQMLQGERISWLDEDDDKSEHAQQLGLFPEES